MLVLSLFSGVGAFESALDRLHIDYTLLNYCEIDKYASKAYSQIHSVSEGFNLGDITRVYPLFPHNIDLITYGFPCQDISNAGKQKGFEDNGERTRSGLFFEALRIIKACRPKIAICENVKNLTGKKFKKEFKIVLDSLEEAGYNNYWKVLDARDYGVPQHRERVFIISIRKDIDDRGFDFPKPIPLEARLRDVLKDEVDEKYYLSEKTIAGFVRHNENHRKNCLRANGALAPTDNTIIVEGNIYPNSGNPQAGRIYNADGICPSLDTCSGGNRMPKIIEVKEATKKGYAEAEPGDSINLEQPNSKTRRGRVGKQVSQTLTTSCNQAVVLDNFRIRRLTPRECFRLMGFRDDEFDRIKGISNTQLYKMAGNSIVVDVLKYIFIELMEQGYIPNWGYDL